MQCVGFRHVAFPLIVALTLTACGGGDGDDPLAPYRKQTVAWQQCDPTSLGPKSEAAQRAWLEEWQRLGTRLQCANVRVPMDWSDPARGDLSVGVLRIAAGDRVRRRGALLMNPGGPGGDGLELPYANYRILSRSNPDHPQGALQLRIVNEFDLVGFSPRGTGLSTRLECSTNEIPREVIGGPLGHLDPDYWDNVQYNNRKRTEACKKNPITPFINTDATARDMDLLRELLGDARLNFLGYSYGTWLGTWYASLFPERVGRMVLDSNVDFSSSFDAAFTAQAGAFQRVLDDVLAPYAARHPQTFNLGTTSAAVRAEPLQWLPAVQSLVGVPLPDKLYSSSAADDALTLLSAGKGLNAVLRSLPEHAPPEQILASLQRHAFNPSDTKQDAAARAAALKLHESAVAQRPPESIRVDSETATFLAVRCNDVPSNTDLAFWKQLSYDYNRRYPLTGAAVDSDSCIYWGGPSVTRPPLAAMAGLDVLLVQSQYDGATPAEGALHAFEALPAARMIYVPGEYTHALYPYEDTCVDLATTRYLLGASPTERMNSCPALPLALDVAQTQTKAAASGVYREPVDHLIDEFKRLVGARPGAPR